jgi:hypothetical protein
MKFMDTHEIQANENDREENPGHSPISIALSIGL